MTNDGFANLTARMGMGAANVFSQGTYLFDNLTSNRLKLEAMYRTSWIVGQAVDAVAEDMTRSGVTIKADMEPESIEKMQSQLTRLGVWTALLDTIKWARLYGGAIAMIVIDGQDPATPLRIDTVAAGQFRGLRVFDRWQVNPSSSFVKDGRDFGLPEYYDLLADVTTGQVSGIKIHHSRIIRQIGIQLPSYQAATESGWGQSIIERMHDRLLAYDTATAGVANLINKAHLRTVQIDKLREVLAAGGKAEENLLQMFHHMRNLQTNEGITLLDKEDAFQAHSYTFSGLSDMLLQLGQQISGATGIPLVRLFGQSPAGLSATGESDIRMYYDTILSLQESRLRDGMSKILEILHRSLFGQSIPAGFDFDFNPLWQTSTKEKADIAAQVTATVTAAFNAGIIPADLALKELKQSGANTGIFNSIRPEDIKEAEGIEPPQIETMAESPSVTDRIKAWLNG